MALLEVAANSVASAFAAQEGGAGRVELCGGLELGGITPSHGTLALAREGLSIPLFVLVRPRPGDFVYDTAEVEVMLDDIAHCRAWGADGIVVGALTPEGDVDVDTCLRCLEAADGMGVTFHRAFDVAADREQALETLVELGFDRVLTSGGMPTAMAGAGHIARWVARAGGRITVMPGAGIDPGNIAEVQALTGANEFHASAKRRLPTAMRYRPSHGLGMGDGETRSDASTVRDLVAALR